MNVPELKEKLEKIENNAKESEQLGGEIVEALGNLNGVVFDTLNKLDDCDITADEAFDRINHLLN